MPDLNKIIEDLSSLSVVEAAELSKQLEEKWGVKPRFCADISIPANRKPVYLLAALARPVAGPAPGLA